MYENILVLAFKDKNIGGTTFLDLPVVGESAVLDLKIKVNWLYVAIVELTELICEFIKYC